MVILGMTSLKSNDVICGWSQRLEDIAKRKRKRELVQKAMIRNLKENADDSSAFLDLACLCEAQNPFRELDFRIPKAILNYLREAWQKSIYYHSMSFPQKHQFQLSTFHDILKKWPKCAKFEL